MSMILPWGTVYGVGQFKDPATKQDYLIIAADGNVYATVENNSPFPLAIPEGETVTVDMTFRQAFDTLIMHRGPTLPALRMTQVQAGFQRIQQSVDGTGTEPIPNAERSLFFQNRLVIPFGNDAIAFSDFNDYTRYAPVIQEFRVNQGSSDKIVTIAKFNDTTIIVFKERSIYAIKNIYGNLAAAQLDLITDEFGCVAAESVQHIGGDLLFLSQLGVMSLSQTDESNQLTVSTPRVAKTPLSEPIQPLIDRINWRYADGAVSGYWNNRYYLAVPLDDAEELKDEILPISRVLTFGSLTVTPLTIGKTYRYVKGNEASLTHNSVTYTINTDFVAATTTATLNTIPVEAPTASIKQVYKGINNAVLVYDVLNQAWTGYDQATGLTPRHFFKFTARENERLFFASEDGYIFLYEEDYEDAAPTPYTDVTLTAVDTGTGTATIRVNAGTAIGNINSSTNNGALNLWGTGGVVLATAQDNLFTDVNIEGGYYGGSAFPWTSPLAPNTFAVQISGGVRFYTTNGVLPNVAITGTFVGKVTINESVTNQISATLVTRGYTHPELELEEMKWLRVDVQTWNPQFDITLITDGTEEEYSIATDVTKDRTKWYKPFYRADFSFDNSSGLFADKFRKDYSIKFSTTNTAIYPQTAGIQCDMHQQTAERYRLPQVDAQYAQVKIVNTTGRIRVNGVLLEASKQYMKALTAA